jgi:hypothetical protein
MTTVETLGFAMFVALAMCVCDGVARAQDYSPPAPMQEWLTATDHQGTIEPGTSITVENWQRYRQFMPLGMQDFFEGKFFWKMPADIRINVRATKVYPLPKNYVKATERYGSQTRVVHLPNGHNDVQGYVAGRPFADPQEPDKGYKILANLWLAYEPHLSVSTPENMANSCTQDRFNNISCTELSIVYRQLGYNTDPGVPHDEPAAGDVWFTEWLMIEEPEESKYTANLLIFHKNNELQQDSYVFVPALRRSLRLSVSARCAPVAGSDYVQDDYKTSGFNGGLALFDAKYLGTRKILALANDYQNVTGEFPNNWDMPLDGLSRVGVILNCVPPILLMCGEYLPSSRATVTAAESCLSIRHTPSATGLKSTIPTCSCGKSSAAARHTWLTFRKLVAS